MRKGSLALSLVVGASFSLATRAASAEKNVHDKDETEIGFFPIVGGTSDVGIGVGFLGALAKFRQGHDDFSWRIEVGALVTYKPHAGFSDYPYLDFYTSIIVPEIAPGIRLELRPSYTKESTLNYYGMGNASVVPANPPTDFYNQYGRTHPTLAALVRFTLAPSLYLRVGNYITYNDVAVYEPSKLQADINSTDPEIRTLVGNPTGAHLVDFVETQFLYDTRDDETEPHFGQFHKLGMRLSPGGGGVFPNRYEQLNATARFYVSPVNSFTLAARLVGDILLDNPPFYELARFDNTYALGGASGVRGVPGQRYYGKVKVFGNLEGRFRLFSFHVFGRRLRMGVAAFVDGGRLWADFTYRPDLNGTALGLKWGAGGGLRLYEASTFAVRFDIAYSPDAHPVGAYLGVGELF